MFCICVAAVLRLCWLLLQLYACSCNGCSHTETNKQTQVFFPLLATKEASEFPAKPVKKKYNLVCRIYLCACLCMRTFLQPLELICEKAIATCNRPLGAGEALRRVMECLASGILLPGELTCILHSEGGVAHTYWKTDRIQSRLELKPCS